MFAIKQNGSAREFCDDRKLEFKIMTEKELGIRWVFYKLY